MFCEICLTARELSAVVGRSVAMVGAYTGDLLYRKYGGCAGEITLLPYCMSFVPLVIQYVGRFLCFVCF